MRLIRLVDGARAHILRAQVERRAGLMLHRKAPLHEIGRTQPAIRDGGDGDLRQAGGGIGQRRCARELALREARIEPLIGRRDGVDGAIGNARRDRHAAHRAQQPALKALRIRRIRAHRVDHASRQDVAE